MSWNYQFSNQLMYKVKNKKLLEKSSKLQIQSFMCHWHSTGINEITCDEWASGHGESNVPPLLSSSGRKLYNLTKQLNIHNFKIGRAQTTRKCFCVSVCGTKSWNHLKEDSEQCPNIEQFKCQYKEIIFSRFVSD